MGNQGWRFLYFPIVCLIFLSLPENSSSSIQNETLKPGFSAAQMEWIDNDGKILISNNSAFVFGFNQAGDDYVGFYRLVVMHKKSLTVVWVANREVPIRESDNFRFDGTGDAYLESGGSRIWSTGTPNKGASEMRLLNSGNLILMGNHGNPIWESFSNPTNTLLSNQNFSQGMKLTSDPTSKGKLNFSLEFKPGSMMLFAGFRSPQPYWSMESDNRRTISDARSSASYAILSGNSWKFYDPNGVLLWDFILSEELAVNATWAATLGNDGLIQFVKLEGTSIIPSKIIPQDKCSTPAACDRYSVCNPGPGSSCVCPVGITCGWGGSIPCGNSIVRLVSGGVGLSYSALEFGEPFLNTTLDSCKTSCRENCSCSALFYDSSSGKCFMFNEIGSMKSMGGLPGANYTSYIKIAISSEGKEGNHGSSGKKGIVVVVIIVIVTLIVIIGLCFAAFSLYKKNKKVPEAAIESSEEDNFVDGLSGMPIRFSYKDLETATNNFSVKLGQGGFGSVYQGTLPDGTRLAVKKLEGVGQGKKEFRAEVSIIGSIHHLHLVRLKGFCAEGSHRLLAYELMANGSLDKWLFKKGEGEFMLEWNTRYNIAVGTAKGLAYLHEDCDAKIVHCDVKPENVLLDDNFMAKVSDFGLAKLMTREQSHVFTTLRGTRGYLAPEWITNYAISEKSDVYSYGMVLLELIGGRKNYDPKENSEKCHLPSYAFKMLEEGKAMDIVDAKVKIKDDDERIDIAIKVALWCIQDDMQLRPSMTRVVQMLEGLCPVPQPPSSSHLGSRMLYTSLFKSSSEGGTSSGPSDCNSDAYLSAVRLSGPR